MNTTENNFPAWRKKVYEVIFEAETPMGKRFDVLLLWAILFSVVIVVLETIPTLDRAYQDVFFVLEWVFTILFTIEYALRIISIHKPSSYIFSFMGLVDLLSILPTYLSLLLAGSHYLMVIRILRLLRIFRILKLVRFVNEARMLTMALRDSVFKIIVFIGVVIAIVLIFATVIYIIEGPENGFDSIPKSMYWTIVTITTVGYGDLAPQTALGRTLASLIMLMGYAIIAVPTGIVTAQIGKRYRDEDSIETIACPNCSKEGHENDALHCKYCGFKIR